jgi:hypothetical protein
MLLIGKLLSPSVAVYTNNLMAKTWLSDISMPFGVV